MKSHEKLLLENKAWVQEILSSNPNYFTEHAKSQHPNFLWIGCSDSRVPVNEITNTHSGDIFVHRNIANLIVHTDLNMLSVLQYATEVLKVKHIIVCGHYGCGGIKAAMSNQQLGLMNKWLRNIKDVYRLHNDELKDITDEEEKTNLMVEFNVKEQVQNLAKTSIVQLAWKKDNIPMLHGWVYSLKTGLLKEICSMNANEDIDPIYRFDFEGPDVH